MIINNIEKNDSKIHECTSCQVCSAVCPKNAISIILDDEGFYKPVVDYDLCINCGLCIKPCYKFDNNFFITEKYDDYEIYSAISRDAINLRTSTSGGVSSILMSELIEQGYFIVGVEYDYDNDTALTDIAYKVYETEKFKGSKYMQAYTEKAFRQIIEDNSDQKYAVFGTPCHIYGINRWVALKGINDRFLFVDVFCHGCPSKHLWSKYLEYYKENNNISKFDKIEFRSKERGWHECCFTFTIGEKRVVTAKTINDPFFRMFFDNHILGIACYNCKIRSSFEYTDIRLGDYWGEKYDLDTKGVSAVIVCTDKGKKVFEEIKNKLSLENENINDIIKAQSYGKIYSYDGNTRNRVIDLLVSDKDMKEIFKVYKRMYSIRRKLLFIIKKLINILPRPTISRIRRLYHKLNRY